mmetsp:Transcript_56004/g.99723  ORF Transcript_56004/g.99723 Transcript_56004/m.99723 type:complete len:335 (-) Transcript_56004:131-1135(-)
MGKICSHSSAETKVSIGGSDISQRSLEALKLKHYGIFGKGICNIPDAAFRMPEDSCTPDEILQVLLLERISDDGAKIEAMPSKLQKDLRPPPNQHAETESKCTASVGSARHPLNCAPDCEYMKQTGGCRDGAACLNCHKCFWTKDPNTRAPPGCGQPEVRQTSIVINSVGSMNHPHGCGDACKYARQKGGCRNGAACPRCHLCFWTKAGKGKLNTGKTDSSSEHGSDATTAASFEVLLLASCNSPWAVLRDQAVELMTPPGLSMGPAASPSLGSTGHPYNCAAACKYFMKPRGCKDGAACSHCHLHPWSRQGQKTHIKKQGYSVVSAAVSAEMQ